MFHVGQLVTYVGKHHSEYSYRTTYTGTIWPELKAVYTVTATTEIQGVQELRFEELPPPDDPAFRPWWRATEFKPIAKTDISTFTAMLSPTKADA
jgi:hypothetical protein